MIRYSFLFLLIIGVIACKTATEEDRSNQPTSDDIREIVTKFYSVKQNGDDYTKEMLLSKDSLLIDTNGIETKISFFDLNGLTYIDSFEYDVEGTRIGSQRIDSENEVIKYTRYHSNEKGQRTMMEVFEKKSDRLLKTILFEYNEKGQRITHQSLDNNNELVNTYRYEYDDDGHEISQKIFDKLDQLTQQNQFKYTKFNKKGQWTEKLGFVNESINSIYQRVFRYY